MASVQLLKPFCGKESRDLTEYVVNDLEDAKKKRSARNLWGVRFLEIFGPPRYSKTQLVEYG